MNNDPAQASSKGISVAGEVLVAVTHRDGEASGEVVSLGIAEGIGGEACHVVEVCGDRHGGGLY